MTNALHEIVRRLQDGDAEQGFPCVVGHKSYVERCERPVAMRVYGLAFCEVHGAECASGALEEMHQDAYEFFERFDNPHVPPIENPLILEAVRNWERAVPEEGRYPADAGRDTDELLLAAFPFREDKVAEETAEEIVDPTPLRRDPPYDSYLYHRYEMHQLMRHAYRLGITYVVESLEAEREWVASQAAYAAALGRGEHPEVLERARMERAESNRRAAEALGK